MSLNNSYANEFTDEEIKEQLRLLGFKNISQEKFYQFKRDLQKLIAHEISLNSSKNQSYASNSGAETKRHAPAATSINRQIGNSNKRVSFPDDQSSIDGNFSDILENECDQSFVSITTTSSVVDNRVVKRKIVRKINPNNRSNKPKHIEHELDSRISELKLAENDPKNETIETLRESEDENENENNSSAEYYHSDSEQIKLNENYAPVNYPLKSFIRSQSSISLKSVDTSRQNMVKSNPVKKYQEYQRMWNRHKAPGERRHNDLRWSIREQMLEKHVIVKRPQRAHAPNNYIIPTEKKRQQLRWMVRSALANPF